jgi:hypothetical protein
MLTLEQDLFRPNSLRQPASGKINKTLIIAADDLENQRTASYLKVNSLRSFLYGSLSFQKNRGRDIVMLLIIDCSLRHGRVNDWANLPLQPATTGSQLLADVAE